MNLPQNLQKAIDKMAQHFSLNDLAKARQRLTERYRNRESDNISFMRENAERFAYVAARMPATYAVCRRVFKEIENLCPDSVIKSVLDLGSGPGTASWAASLAFENVESFCAVEQDSHLIELAKVLASHSENSALQRASWQNMCFDGSAFFEKHDLVVCSYSVGELPALQLLPFIEASWKATSQFLVIIEPGTPLGFSRISAIRNYLISLGANIIAPCTHTNACPLANKKGEWCHFSQRFERSFLHSYLKEGSIGFEDEKFSYVIFSKSKKDLPRARVLSDPSKRSGHVCLKLCVSDGEIQEIVSKKTKETYKIARKLSWGSVFNY